MNSRFAPCYLENLSRQLKRDEKAKSDKKVVKLDYHKKYEEKKKNKSP